VSQFEDLATRVSQSVSALSSGAISHGAFPWERSRMTESDVRREYGTTGVQVLKDFRRASENGGRALASFREHKIGNLQFLDSQACRKLNDGIEEGKLTFADVHEQYGDRGLDALEQYRKRHFYEHGVISGDRDDPATVQHVDSFRAQGKPPTVIYHHANERDEVRPPAFVDHGSRVAINEAKNPNVVAAALELSAHKWDGKFQVSGTDEYKALCVQIAAERGYSITNPELQAALSAAKKSIAATKSDVSSNPGIATAIADQFHASRESYGNEVQVVNDDSIRSESEAIEEVVKADGMTMEREPQKIALDLSEDYARLLVNNAYPNNIRSQAQAMYDVAVQGKPLELNTLGLDNVQLHYSEEVNQFYASIEPDRKPALEKTLGRLVSQQRVTGKGTAAQQKPESENERD